MNMKTFTLALMVSFIMLGCDSGTISPNDAFLIRQDQLSAVMQDANNGDLVAVKKLIAHYEATSGNEAVADVWRAKARSLGDAQELYYYAAKLFTAAKVETDPAKKHEMLEEALKAAELSSSSHADPYTQQLIEDITRSIKEK